VRPKHRSTVSQETEQRPKGRPVHPAVAAVEGLVESLAVVQDDARAFRDGAIHLAAIQRVAIRLADQQRSRAERLLGQVYPEILSAYRHGEAAWATERAA